MAVFGKRRRLKRVPVEKGKFPGQTFRLQPPPLKQKRLKLAMFAVLTLASLLVVHMNHLFRPPGFWKLGWHGVAGSALVLILLNWAFWIYTVRFHREVVASVKRFVLVGVLVLGTLLAARLMSGGGSSQELPVNLCYLIPMAFTILTLTIVFNQQFGLMAAAYLGVCVALVLEFTSVSFSPEGFPVWEAPEPGVFRILVVLLGGSVTAALTVGRIRDRSKLIKVGAGVGLVLAVMILASEAMHGATYRDLASVGDVLVDPLWGLASGLMMGFLVSGALPFIEYFFDVTTDISLIELSDHNHPLLRRLLLEAPGTYHHSFITGTLAEAASEAIGANSLLARVGGYFHDVGKINKPEYFTENESHKGSHHGRLSPTMSTLIIIAHTKDGIEMAKDYNLPPAIIDFIPQHHGTSVIEYFYREALEQSAGRFKVRQDYFRHLGPKPQTKETAIVSLADSVEAASRSLSDPTPARLEGMVHNIVTKKLMDDQLDESTLTFLELKTVEDTFLRVLAGIFHGRIAYPDSEIRKAQ